VKNNVPLDLSSKTCSKDESTIFCILHVHVDFIEWNKPKNRTNKKLYNDIKDISMGGFRSKFLGVPALLKYEL
jgi:hypothetical protein